MEWYIISTLLLLVVTIGQCAPMKGICKRWNGCVMSPDQKAPPKINGIPKDIPAECKFFIKLFNF